MEPKEKEILITRNNDSEQKIKNSESASMLKEILRFAVISILIVFPIRAFVAEPFIVNGSSMDPTFETGHYLIVDRITYRFEEPKRGDVIIFKYPKDPSKYFIKRVIGLPGDTVLINNGTISIKNDENKNGFSIDEPYISSENIRQDNLTVTLPENQYFVMGDNRLASADSRMWGNLPKENIVGRAALRLFPLKGLGILPGKYEY